MQTLINNFLRIGGIEAASRILSWGTPFFLAMILPAEEYGIVTILIAIENILLSLYVAGLDKALLKFGSDILIRYDLVKKSQRIWSVQAVTVTVATLIVLEVIRSHVTDAELKLSVYELTIFFVGVSFVGLNRIHNAQYRVFNDVKGYFGSRLGAQLIRLVLILYAIFLVRGGIGYIYGTLAFILVVFFQIYKNSKLVNSRKVSTKSILHFSWPYIPHVAAASVVAYSDKLVLQSYVSLQEMGSYGFAYLIGSSITFIYGVMASYFEPYFYNDSSSGEVEPIEYAAVQIFIGMVLGAIFIVLIHLSGFSNKYSHFLDLAPIILCAYLFHPIYLSGNYMLAKRGRSGLIASGTLISGAITIGANLLLAPIAGALGAAIATTIGFGVLSMYIGIVSGFLRINRSKYFFIFLSWMINCGLVISLITKHGIYAACLFFSLLTVNLLIIVNRIRKNTLRAF